MNNKKVEITNSIVAYFDQGFACSQSMLLGFADHYNLDKRTAKLISSTFGGGMGRLRRTCGALTGAYMVLGLEYGNEIPDDLETKLHAYSKVKELTKNFEETEGTSNCKEILKKYATDKQVTERKHHKIVCRRVVKEVAELLCDMIIATDNCCNKL